MDPRHLATSFDDVADLYHDARPDYPVELYEALVAATGIRDGDRVLEVGCGTGKASLPLAERGLRMTCVDPGPALVAHARRNLAGHEHVEVMQGSFESLDLRSEKPWDLVVAATSWHWTDPAVRYRRAWELLRPRGHLAFWTATHVFPDDGDPFFDDLQEVYDEIGAGQPTGTTRPRPGELPDDDRDIEDSGLFTPVETRQLAWEVDYDVTQYLRLLDTFSGHIRMHPAQRHRLYDEIRRRLRDRPDGTVRRGWGAVLHVARRRDHPG